LNPIHRFFLIELHGSSVAVRAADFYWPDG
jgi:hypothetical protein